MKIRKMYFKNTKHYFVIIFQKINVKEVNTVNLLMVNKN